MEIKYYEDAETFYLETECGDEYEVNVDYDYSPAEKADLEYPGCDAEFIVNEVYLGNGFPIELDWIKNLKEFSDEMASKGR